MTRVKIVLIKIIKKMTEFLDLILEREEIDEHTIWQFNKREK